MEIKADYRFISQLPTIHSGQYANLKIDTGTVRVWQSRLSIEDGEIAPIQIEKLIDGRWEDHYGDIHLEGTDGHTYVVEYTNRNTRFRRDYDNKSYDWDFSLQ